MVFTYNKRNYCLFVDWLSFSVTMLRPNDELKCPEGYRLEQYDGNNIFKKRAIILDEQGCKLITLLWQPHSTLLHSSLMTVQFSNEVLYFERERECLRVLSKVVDYTFNSFSRIDFALDFQTNSTQNKIIRKLFNGSMYVQGKKEGSMFWHEGTYKGVTQRVAHCLSWGAQGSKIRCKLYYKSREQNLLEENGMPDKPYIIDVWKSAGFDTKSVWRLEFSLNSSGQLIFGNQPITWNNYFDCEWWYIVFMSLYSSRFVVRRNEGKREGHKNNDSIVSFLDLPSAGKYLKWKKNVEPEQRSEVVSAIRRIMKELESPLSMACDDVFASHASTLETIVSRTRMEGYFIRMTGSTVQEYCSNLYQNVGAGVFTPELKPSMKWE